nr:heparan-alpha-glucosaminide N-acetyltransferase [Methylobacterium nonmethylotrophicum]
MPARRLALVDVARGVALLAMALYHLTWDLGFLRLTPENAALSPLGRAAAHGIAGSFLLLVGVSLVLSRDRTAGWRSFLARIGRIGAAAAAISLATSWLFPESWIFFGILHCIAVSSVLALPALAAPLPVVWLAAALVLAGPTLAALAGGPPLLDAPGLLFLGLGAVVPTTNDYVPLFPWFGFVLAGVGLGRMIGPRLAASRLGAWAPRGRAGRLAARAGRHSLAIYLVHQPLLLGLLYGVAALTGPHPRAGEAQFLREYGATCAAAGSSEAICRATARCVLVRLRETGLWAIADRPLTAEERAIATSIAQACLARNSG